MILKQIRIKNFRSYYGEHTFELSKGLTLIIGDNGDGKSTFIDALKWLFDTTTNNKDIKYVSEKRKSELNNTEQDEVSVSIVFDHDGEKELVKKFIFERNNDNFLTRDYAFDGYFVDGPERLYREGKWLLDTYFKPEIRKYCIFKGEGELNVFDNDSALSILVDTFSAVRDYDSYVTLTAKFETNAGKVLTNAMKSDKKNAEIAKNLDTQLTGINAQIQDIIAEIKQTESTVSDFNKKLRLLEENQELSENYKRIVDRIKDKQAECNKLKAYIDVDYNALLLDDMWILSSFPSIINEFKQKIQKFSKEKRRLKDEETKKMAQRDLVTQIKNDVTKFIPLPWDLPDDAHMKEMLDEEVCKVCGRPAKKGSEAYQYMERKLQDYLDHIQATAEKQKTNQEEKQLFPYNYIEELHNRSIRLSGDTEQEVSEISSQIEDRIAFIQARKLDLEQKQKDLQEAEDERTRLLAQSNGLGENDLLKNFSDYKGYSETSKRAENSLIELKYRQKQLQEKKDAINKQLSEIEPENNTIKTYQKIQKVLKCIANAFADAKESNINNFINLLEEKANKYLVRLNSQDFHGEVRILRTGNDNARIALYSSNGIEVYDPSDSQRTTVYMSVLFAISEITTLKRDADYPLIFDAPTSSFSEMKTADFYNTIDNIDKQCIIVTKDLLKLNTVTAENDIDMIKVEELNCPVYRIKKAKGFNQSDLSTIQTISTKIK